jgi:hypothetical protein
MCAACDDIIRFLISSVLPDCRIVCYISFTLIVSMSVVLTAKVLLAEFLGAANWVSSRTFFNYF